jgi:hypothetical protein
LLTDCTKLEKGMADISNTAIKAGSSCTLVAESDLL